MQSLNPNVNERGTQFLTELNVKKYSPYSPRITGLLASLPSNSKNKTKAFESLAKTDYAAQSAKYEADKKEFLNSKSPNVHILSTKTTDDSNRKRSFDKIGLGVVNKSTSYSVYEFVNRPVYNYSSSASNTDSGRGKLLIAPLETGKKELVSQKPSSEYTAETTLRKRLSQIRRSGRVSMPSGARGSDEPTINISSGGSMGLNFT